MRPISSKISTAKKKERKKERARRKKGHEEKKSNGYTLKFYNGYYNGYYKKKKIDGGGLFSGSGKNPAGEIYIMPYIFVLKLLHTKYCKK